MARDLRWEEFSGFQRFALGVLVAFAAIFFFPVWMPIVGLAVVAYVGYRIVRAAVRIWHDDVLPSPQPTSPPAAPIQDVAAGGEQPVRPVSQPMPAAATRPPWRRRSRPGWRQAAFSLLSARPVRERASSVLGSMLVAAVVSSTAALLVGVFATSQFSPELALWVAVVATMASWGVMVPAQLAEGRLDDHAPLRFSNLLLGALVGAAAWGLAEVMYLQPFTSSAVEWWKRNGLTPGPNDTLLYQVMPWRGQVWSEAFRIGGVGMPLGMYAGYFALVLAFVRWWRLAEWTRATRVSFWAIAWSMFIAWAISFFCWFPQPTGLLLAGVIALSVQLASPWLSRSERRELAQKAV